jgi:oxalate decarboxylase/phosphoglucose isomerase-like protein (cupin superfamily)
MKNIPFIFREKQFAIRTLETMKPVLMFGNKVIDGPTPPYYMARGRIAGLNEKGHNITLINPGIYVREDNKYPEYNKTYGHYHTSPSQSETYWINHGEGYCILQKIVSSPDGTLNPNIVEYIKIIKISKGSRINIKGDEGHLLVNTSNIGEILDTLDDCLVHLGDSSVNKKGHADYQSVTKAGGFVYFIVMNKDGTPALIKNPYYEKSGRKILKEELGGLLVVTLK